MGRFMRGKKVVYENKSYIVLHDYGNGQIEIQLEGSNSYRHIKLVEKEDIQFKKVDNEKQ
ncbi:MAG: hypothetical protein ACK4M9_05965 [Anaerobacillus sp.]|uniref:hypothetical protein n=1 Tax=Anaerobacillus sp. TaxID=1872506 RepID=UPI0039195B47